MARHDFGLGHPDHEIALGIELEVLEGWLIDVAAGLRSEWPFWARLSRLLAIGRKAEWFGRADWHDAAQRLLGAFKRGWREVAAEIVAVRASEIAEREGGPP